MVTLREWLSTSGWLADIMLSNVADVVLSALVVDGTTLPTGTGAVVSGSVQAGSNATPLFLDLSIAPSGPAIPFRLSPVTEGFDLALDLGAVPPATRISMTMAQVTGAALQPAIPQQDADGVWLEAGTGSSTLGGTAVVLVIEGRRGATSSLSLRPSMTEPAGIVHLTLDPQAALIGSSGFGLELPQGLLLDLSGRAAAPAAPFGPLQADDPAWIGMSVRGARFFLPLQVPWFGRTAIPLDLDIGLSPSGIALIAEAHVPQRGTRPEMNVRIECQDPQARGLAGFAPTLVEAALTLNIDHPRDTIGSAPLTIAGGRPLVARARFVRSPLGATELSVGIESTGEGGVLTVTAAGGGVAEKAVIAAAAFATALMADSKLDGPGGVGVTALATAGMALSTFLNDKGLLVVHAVELKTEGRSNGIALADKQSFTVDYSVDVAIKPIDLGIMQIGLVPEQPLRIRMRGVVLSLDHAKSGMGMFQLDFEHAAMEVEDPGRWLLDGPGSLFDVLGSRSGRGSLWVELDLRFKLDLGPVKVSGATVRASFDVSTGKIGASIRGLDASIDIPGTLSGSGKLEAIPGGFSASLSVNIVPLGVGALAELTVAGKMLLLRLAVDLPGPLPLFNSGLALFGLGGTFGIAARIALADGDPVTAALAWRPATGFEEAAGQLSFGLETVVGTLPDLGHAFSAKGGLFLTVPELVVLGSLDAQMLAGRRSMTDDTAAGPITIRGTIVVDPATAVTFALEGKLQIPVLLTAVVPAGGHFPIPTETRSDWYVHLGADGYRDADPAKEQGRQISPARMTVLPGFFKQTADAYVMAHGKGMSRYPRGEPLAQDYAGFVLAFGFGFDMTFGVKAIVWVEVSARLDVLVASRPLIVAGLGRISGSAHLGPVSVGVSADIEAFVVGGRPRVHAQVCAHVNLLFTTLRKCASLRLGEGGEPDIPMPDALPIDRLEGETVVGEHAVLLDDGYHLLADLVTDERQAPTVWPDALIGITFAWPPELAEGFAPQFPGATYPEGVRAGQMGGGLLEYEWTLTGVTLWEKDAGGNWILSPGNIAAAWQDGRLGDPGQSGEPAELVLLDIKSSFFLNRVVDAGVSLPHDPLRGLAEVCKPRPGAQAGWLLGGRGVRIGDWWRLPPDVISPNPLQSRVAGTLVPGFRVNEKTNPVRLDEFGVRQLPAEIDYRSPKVASLRTPLNLEHAFDDALSLGTATDALLREAHFERLGLRMVATLFLDEPIQDDALLVVTALMTTGRPAGADRIGVADAHGKPWSASLVDEATGLMAFKAQGARTPWLTITWVPGAQVALLGLRATTVAAVAATGQREAARTAEAARQAEAAAAGPATDPTVSSATGRRLLTPGTEYRVDVAFRWDATLYKQNRIGPRTVRANKPGVRYLPAGGVEQDAAKSFYFKTTPVPPPRPAQAASSAHAGIAYATPHALLTYGQAGRLQTLHRAQDVFAPELLERHLAGYQPAQSEVARFRHDPLQAHFKVGHVEALARLYGYSLSLGLRRIDTSAPSGDLKLMAVVVGFGKSPTYFAGTDRRRFDLLHAAGIESVCPHPGPGATFTAVEELEARAWYELFVDAARTDGAPHGRLPGVTFQTSRWWGVDDMLPALGFGASAGPATGDLEVRSWTPATSLDNDCTFDDALENLGLESWPPAAEPRTSLLWSSDPGGTWKLCGLLLESPEPVHRHERCHVDHLEAIVAPTVTATFDRVLRDRSGSRLIFMTTTPFVPEAWMTRRPILAARSDGLTNTTLASLRPLPTAVPRLKPGGGPVPSLKPFPRPRPLPKPLPVPFPKPMPMPMPIQHQPQLRLHLIDLRPDGSRVALSGLLALASRPVFASEAS